MRTIKMPRYIMGLAGLYSDWWVVIHDDNLYSWKIYNSLGTGKYNIDDLVEDKRSKEFEILAKAYILTSNKAIWRLL